MTLPQNPEARIKVLVADSAAMSCGLLADALQRGKQYQALAAVTSTEVLHALDRNRIDVVLVSTAFDEQPLGGLRVLREIRKSHPQVEVVLLLDSSERNLVIEAFRSGARGVFCRADSFQALCKCILCVHEGQVWANTTELHFILEALLEPTPIDGNGVPGSRGLSKREGEIARLVADGLSNRQISERLALSEHTVKNYLFRVFEKLGVSTRVELTLYALNRRGQSASKSQTGRAILADSRQGPPRATI